MLLKVALAIALLIVLAGVLVYVAGVLWATCAVVLVAVILVVHWSRRGTTGARPGGGGGGVVPGGQEPAVPTTEPPSTVVVVVAAAPSLPRREPVPVQPSAPVADDETLLAYGYGKSDGGGAGIGGGGDGEECSVCLGEMRQGEAAKRMPVCQHVFHEGCIDMWLSLHGTCPVCRSPVHAGASTAASAAAGRRAQPC